jgi:hypothetical protein
MPLNRNKTGQFVLIEVLPLMRLAANVSCNMCCHDFQKKNLNQLLNTTGIPLNN